MLVVPELEREVELLWELRGTRKVLIQFLGLDYLDFCYYIILV